MHYQFQYRPYRRPFRQPLHTSHGIWAVREGILLQLTDETGRIGWGEIAPIPWFGSETIAQALAVCRQLPSEITHEQIGAIRNEFPACQFGFESALESLTPEPTPATSGIHHLSTQAVMTVTNYCVLLPTGRAALEAWKPFWKQGYRTFKLKIGCHDFKAELDLCMALRSVLMPPCLLRLDANGALSIQQAKVLLEACDHTGIEFVEQPLPPDQFDAMQQLAEQYQTTIALDESIATFEQLHTCYQDGWRGVFVVKPAIVGSPLRLRQFCQTHAIDAVFSSTFETAIGRQAGLRLAAELANPDRALGYGTTHWFNDADLSDPEQLWQTL